MATPASDQGLFRLAFPGFEGSISELMHALRVEAVLPTQVPLLEVVRSYLMYFAQFRADPELATEALPAVGGLVELKTRLLLPRPPRLVEDEDDEPSLRDVLSGLEILQQLEDAIAFLRDRRLQRRTVFPARGLDLGLPRPERPLGLGVSDLVRLARRRLRDVTYFELTLERLTVKDQILKLRRFLGRLFGQRGSLDQLLERRDREELAVTFIALMELIKEQEASARQGLRFGPIEIEAGKRARPAG